MIEYMLPNQDASTFEGQALWFMAGFIYASVIASVALMIRLFRQAAGTGAPYEG